MYMQEMSSLQNEPQGPGRCLFSLPMAIHSMSAWGLSPDGQPQHQPDLLVLAASSPTAASLGCGAQLGVGCAECFGATEMCFKARKFTDTEI